MKRLYVPLAMSLLLFSCSSNRQWLSSYLDPDFVNVAFRSVAVRADTSDLAWRQGFERSVIDVLKDEGAVGYEWSALFPPTRNWSDEQVHANLQQRNIDAYLTVCAVNTVIVEEVIPERRVTTREEKPIVERVRYRENGKWVEKDSVTGYRELITTTTDPSRVVVHVRKQFHLALIDVLSGKTAWIGDYWADIGTQFLRAMCAGIAKQMMQDGIVRKKG